MRLQHGVARVELIIIAIMVGMLLAIAVMSYRNHVLTSQRSDAKDALLELATRQEKHNLQCGGYASRFAVATNCTAGQLQGTDLSRNRGYLLTIGPAAPTATTFIVTATAVAGQESFHDTACRSFSVTQDGVRMAFDSGGSDNTAECWR